MEDEKKPKVVYDRVTDIRLDWLEENIKEINETLYNDGKGIVYDVKQLKYSAQSNNSRFAAIINVISVLISFVVMILLIIEKMK